MVKSVLSGKKAYKIEEILKEKRFSPRIQCEIQAMCFIPGEDVPVNIANLGLYGMQIHVNKELMPGEKVRITPIKGAGILSGARYNVGSIAMKVLWSKEKKTTGNFIAGLRYDDTKKNFRESWVAFLLRKYGFTVGGSSQKRKNIRIPVNLSLSYRSIEGDIDGTGIVRDVGLGGMLIAIEKEISSNRILKFRIGPYKSLESLICNGRVLHNKFAPTSGKWITGVIFVDLDEAGSKLLNLYLSVLFNENLK